MIPKPDHPWRKKSYSKNKEERVDKKVIDIVRNTGGISPRALEIYNHGLDNKDVRISIQKLVAIGRLVIDNELKLCVNERKQNG